VKPDRFERLKEILLKAADLSEAEREVYLDEACKDDPDLRKEAESILAHEADPSGILKTAGAKPGELAASDDRAAAAGEDSTDTPPEIDGYRIIGKLGEGGMGVVYRGEDTTLRREVALKTLPVRFADDPERVARLEREARTLASLQHPNVAALFGLEEAGGQSVLVMEMVEGEDLAARLRRGALPVDETLDIALQVAKGLEAAHEKDIVHRDLKPANVKVTPQGQVKILDFGLARAYQGDTTADGDMANSPTISEVMTQKGVILGTAAYMSPEQARGKRVDWRSDIWAFGCLLYELLTGVQAFPGETVSDTLVSILEREPDWEQLPKRLPPGILRLLQRCLTKDVRNRLQAIGDARIAIQESLSAPSAQGEAAVEVEPRPIWQRLAPWVLLPLVAVLIWVLKPEKEPVSLPTVRFEIPVPEGERLTSYFRHAVAMTTDGRTLAFVSGTTSDPRALPDTTHIYIRSLDEQQARPVPGTENGIQPFFSPDGRWLGFIRGNQLMKVAVAGGEPVALCECAGSCGASWGPDGTIIFASMSGVLQRVSDSGGDPDSLTRLNIESGEIHHRLPQFLPDGETVLFTALRYRNMNLDWGRARIYARSLVTGERELLIEGGSDARYLPTGHLVFAREARLMVVRFDPDRLEVMGPEVPVLEGVSHSIHTGSSTRETGAAHFAVSATGVLAYIAGSVFPEIKRPVLWVNRQGREEETLGVDSKHYSSVRVSPDGHEVLLTAGYPPRDVWIWDLDRQLQRRQTFEGNHLRAIWGPEPDDFTVDSDREGPHSLCRKTVDSGPGHLEKLPTDIDGVHRASSWSPDGEELAFVVWRKKSGHDVMIFSRDGRTAPFLHTRFCEHDPEFSPDGRWLVYTSEESGQEEVYVRPYPGPGRAVQISIRGGVSPAWSRDGREIFYRQRDEFDRIRKFYAVQLDVDGDRLTPGQPEMLFEGAYLRNTPIRGYDVAPDGRFLLIKNPDEASLSAAIEELFPTRIQVVQNWFAELREKMPEGE
jgi:serine/threonine-protein kinase